MRFEKYRPPSKNLASIMIEDFTMPRSPTIARIFRAIKISENAGSGFDKMFPCWKAHYGKEPIVSKASISTKFKKMIMA